MTKSEFFKASDSLQKVFSYQDSKLEILLPSLCMRYCNLLMAAIFVCFYSSPSRSPRALADVWGISSVRSKVNNR